MSTLTPYSVTGDIVDLVPINEGDIDDITAALQNPLISERTLVPYPYSRADAEWFIGDAARQWDAGSPHWTIRDTATNAFIGTLALFRNGHTPDTYEIGYWVKVDQWGRGLCTAAVKLAVTSAFQDLEATRVEWFTDADNWGSWKPVWRCGFRREGTQRRARGLMWGAGLLKGDPLEPATPWDGPLAPRSENSGPTASDSSSATQHLPVLDPSRPGDLVAQFHSVYSLPNRLAEGEKPEVDIDRLAMRISLIAEEFAEFMGAVRGQQARALVEEATKAAEKADDGTRNTVEAADALADLIYVIYGMALECGMNLDAVLAEVQASNLSKLMPDGSVKLREDGKVLKGPDFFPPNIARALGLE
ncbi:MAG: GNAT family N-acetyltransferase [Actinomycetaceae bacterium]|nr:GNAT family N-acetyltransferase [Actinomycetaceae bacterium]